MAGLLKWEKSSKRVIQEIDQEWESFVNEHAFRDEEGYLIYGHRLLAAMGEEALKTARYLSRRGHWESTKLLIEYMLGQPEQPFTVQISTKSAAETREMIVAEITKMKLAPETAEGIAERARLSALESNEL